MTSLSDETLCISVAVCCILTGPKGLVHSLWLSDLRTTVEMKGFTDELNYIVELLEGGTTLEDVIDNHTYEQALVSRLIHYAV